jgi:hypothetical protein
LYDSFSSPSQKHSDLQSLQAQSTGEDSNSSDTVASDAGDVQMDGLNGSMDHSRTSSFANSFLGLQNIPGLLPGPSGMPDNFGESQFASQFSSPPFFINKFNNKNTKKSEDKQTFHSFRST